MAKQKIVVDGIHGDIKPTSIEWQIINTATFQRLRQLKQLQLAYYVYPNATHTRLAHSLGVLHITGRVLDILKGLDDTLLTEEDDIADLRIAALLHDIGHYPYSHLLEYVDKVKLTEDVTFPPLSKSKEQGAPPPETAVNVMDVEIGASESIEYPDHEELGQHILTHREDLVNILTEERAKKIALYFSESATEMPEIAKLIHSSLDMDRMDYLLRDGQATGVPYGNIDIHYLLNHVKIVNKKVGISMKALPAAEHFLLGRAFLQRTVCHHKTVHGIEEAAKQLIRRLKDRQADSYGIPRNRSDVFKMIESDEFYNFTDAYLDEIIRKACKDKDPVIAALAEAVAHRRPPLMFWEYKTFKEKRDASPDNMLFTATSSNLKKIADEVGIDVRYFMVSTTKPVGFERRGSTMFREEAKEAHEDQAAEQMIRVFETRNSQDPTPIVDVRSSLLHAIGGHAYHTYRVFFVRPKDYNDNQVDLIRKKVRQMYDGAFEIK